MAEWLRRLTRNQLGSARVGSNPTGRAFLARLPANLFKDNEMCCRKSIELLDKKKQNPNYSIRYACKYNPQELKCLLSAIKQSRITISPNCLIKASIVLNVPLI